MIDFFISYFSDGCGFYHELGTFKSLYSYFHLPIATYVTMKIFCPLTGSPTPNITSDVASSGRCSLA